MRQHLTLKVPTHCKMIIAYLGRNVKDYRKNFLRYLGKLEFLCPVCGSNTGFHDCYNRHVHLDEKIEWIVIQRVICISCGKTHAVLPDFIRPYKHYCTADTEFVLKDINDGTAPEKVETAASTQTVKRWFREFKEKGAHASGALRAILNKLSGKIINELTLVELNIFRTLEYILQQFQEIESNGLTIGDANIWLTHYMAGIYV